MNSLFCRHNRFTADCPICSKGTVLDPERPSARPRPPRGAGGGRKRAAAGAGAATRVAGPYASAGPYEDAAGESYDVRLERVPGGIRLAEWAGGQIRRRAPVLEPEGLAALLSEAHEREVLRSADADALVEAAGTEPAAGAASDVAHGASRGRAGDMQDELRLERLDGERLRLARWILRPRAGWELQEAPVMLPAARFAEAIRGAAAAGLLVS